MRPIRFTALSILICTSLLVADSDRPPNILFILADDLGYSDIEPYGQKDIQTPQLAKLAREGMLFTHAYAGNSLCGPSRSVLLQGLHSGHSSIRHNPAKARGWDRTTQGDPPLPDDAPTFATVLKEAGYATACFGKWGMGLPGQAGSPKRLGFDFFLGYATHVDAHDYRPDHLWKNDQKIPLDGKTYTHDLFTNGALAYIRDHQDDPFLLYLSYTIPHGPYDPPSVTPYENQPWHELNKAYAAMVTRLDSDIGKLVSLLDQLKIAEDTVVLFASDNGPSPLGEHRIESFHSTPFRGGKGTPYEGGLRVPLIVKWPNKVAPGTQSDLPVCFYDFLPAFADLAGQDNPPGNDGISFVPTLLGDNKTQTIHDYLYWELGDSNDWQAVRKGDWKAIRWKISIPNETKLELFHLETDPKESTDVSNKHPAVVARMERIFREAHTPNLMFPLTRGEIRDAPPNIVTPNAKQKERMRARALK